MPGSPNVPGPASGLGLPIMMTVANCAIDAPINIWNGHSDGMSRRFEIDYDYCKPCGICVSKCPCGAFRMEPEDR